MLNRWVLSRDRKTATEGAEVTRSGRLFQTRAAATGKAPTPTVGSRVRLTINDEKELERSRWRASTSATWKSWSVRYGGAECLCTSYRAVYILNSHTYILSTDSQLARANGIAAHYVVIFFHANGQLHLQCITSDLPLPPANYNTTSLIRPQLVSSSPVLLIGYHTWVNNSHTA